MSIKNDTAVHIYACMYIYVRTHVNVQADTCMGVRERGSERGSERRHGFQCPAVMCK